MVPACAGMTEWGAGMAELFARGGWAEGIVSVG